jgi:hypothetical protein
LRDRARRKPVLWLAMNLLRSSTVKNFRPFSFALAAALLLLARGIAVSLEVYGSTAGEYSASFPAPPEENTRTGPNFRIVSHALRANGVIYIVAHGDFTEPVNAEVELDANIVNYVNEIRGSRLTSRGPIAFARGDKSLPAKQFTFDGELLKGKGIVVVDGKSSYLVSAGSMKPDNHEAAVDAFLASFRLVPGK